MKAYTYELKGHQEKTLEKLNRLDLSNLYYLTIQQDRRQPNFTLDELKRHIKRGIKKSVKAYYKNEYKSDLENEKIQFVGIIETSKDFFWSQTKVFDFKNEIICLDLHIHLFITTSSFIHIPQVIENIKHSFSSQKNKTNSIKKSDYRKLGDFDEDFKHYHTKQGMFYDNTIYDNNKS